MERPDHVACGDNQTAANRALPDDRSAPRRTRLNAVVHVAYLAGIALKGIDGLIEICAGVALLLLAPSTIAGIIAFVANIALAEGPLGALAAYAPHITSGLTVGTERFVSAYLLVHGAIKLGLVVGLMCHWRHAYPVAVALLTAFVGYQFYRLVRYHSPTLAVFTALDVGIVLLIACDWYRTEHAR